MFSLFATLFARLWYLQVVSGDELPGPGRLPVGARDRGAARSAGSSSTTWAARWSPTARRGWSPSTGRCSARWPSGSSSAARAAAAAEPSTCRRGGSSSALLNCGDPGAYRGHVLERLAVPAGAGRHATSRRRSRCGSSSRPRTTRPCSPSSRRVRAYPRAVRHQRRAPARLPQPDHRDELDEAEADGDLSVNGASVGRPGRRREAVRRVAARHARLPAAWRSTRWAGCSATTASSPASRATRWSPRSTPGSRPSSSSSSPRPSRPRARPATR